jgi:hypothetical protein
MTNETGSVTVTNGSETTTYELESALSQSTLSHEFTDQLLEGIIQSQATASMPPYPTDWASGDATASTTFTLDFNHISGSETVVQYRLMIPGSALGVTYHCHWLEESTDSNGNSLPPTMKYGDVAGTGDPNNPAPGPILNVPMPQLNGTVSEAGPVIDSTSGSNDASAPPAGSGDNN